MNRIGIKDVARRAGVSLGTVSNVLNRPESVADETRLRVQAVIAELGYVRNESARQLRAGSSRSIGLVVLDAANPFFTDIALGAEQAAAAGNLIVSVFNSAGSTEREDQLLELLLEQRVSGVLLSPIFELPAGVARLMGHGVPVVLLDRDAGGDSGFCSVSVDDVAGGRQAAEHLIDLGHRRIEFVGGPVALPQIADRYTGVQQAADAANEARKGPTVTVRHLETTGLRIADGREAGDLIVEQPAAERPTAVVCGNDLVALGVLQAVIRSGLRVPHDVAIVGYDDIEFAEAATVALSSVRQPRELLGRTATELLLDEVSDRERHVHREVVYRPELVVRESSATRPG